MLTGTTDERAGDWVQAVHLNREKSSYQLRGSQYLCKCRLQSLVDRRPYNPNVFNLKQNSNKSFVRNNFEILLQTSKKKKKKAQL